MKEFWLDRFIPHRLLTDSEIRLRSRIFVSILIVCFTLTLIMQFLVLILRSIPQERLSTGHIVLLSIMIVYLAVFLIFRKIKTFVLAGNIFIASFFLIHVSVFVMGYINSTHIIMWPAIPLLSFLICGRNSGLIWTIISMVTHVSLMWFNENGTLPLINRYSLYSPFFISFIVICCTYGFVAACSLVYDILNTRLRDQLNIERNKFQYQAEHDALTGLLNRHAFKQVLSASLIHQRFGTGKLALIYLDLNDFKPINDNYGHEAGDVILQAVANRLHSILRESDFVARLGGDEFAIILSGIKNKNTIDNIVHKILSVIAQPVIYKSKTLQVTGSVGVAIYPDHGHQPESLLSAADGAMYMAKRSNQRVCIAGEYRA